MFVFFVVSSILWILGFNFLTVLFGFQSLWRNENNKIESREENKGNEGLSEA